MRCFDSFALAVFVVLVVFLERFAGMVVTSII